MPEELLAYDDQIVQCPLCDHRFNRDKAGIWSKGEQSWHCPNCTIQLYCDADSGEVIGFGPLCLHKSKLTPEQRKIVRDSFKNRSLHLEIQ